jgi:hypothetical protein
MVLVVVSTLGFFFLVVVVAVVTERSAHEREWGREREGDVSVLLASGSGACPRIVRDRTRGRQRRRK